MIGGKKSFLDSLLIAVSEKDFWNYMELYSFSDKLNNALAEKAVFLQEEQERINRNIWEATNAVNLAVEKFKLNFVEFKHVGMMTKKELLSTANEKNKDQIVEMVKLEDEDNPDEDMFWDHRDVVKWGDQMKE